MNKARGAGIAFTIIGAVLCVDAFPILTYLFSVNRSLDNRFGGFQILLVVIGFFCLLGGLIALLHNKKDRSAQSRWGKIKSAVFICATIGIIIALPTVVISVLSDRVNRENAANAFETAMNENTVVALESYLSEWHDNSYAEGEYIEQAESRVAQLLNDGSISAPILGSPDEASQEMIDTFLRDYPGHMDEERVMAMAEGDFLSLLQEGAISISITGQNIERTTVALSNKLSRDLNVTIPLGVYFASSSGDVQNMVVRSPASARVPAGQGASVSVATACMNIHRDIPNSNNSFLAMTLDNERLERVVRICDELGASYAVTQAAVWIVTDNPSDRELTGTLMTGGVGGGYGRVSVIKQDDLAEAKRIVEEVG
ncbi:MAG: thioester domain-containing protein [Oscillospiraceae bacterium]|nr:thioester domain-containing protein [Oscillospiraceae bacterium]